MPRTIEINLNEFYPNVAKSKYSNICEKSYMDYIGKENNKNIRVTLKYYKDLLNEMKYNQYICGEMEKTYSQCYDKTDEKYEAIDLEKILKFEKVGYMEKLHKTDITYENICDENKIDQTDKYCHNSIPINYAIKNKITYSIKFRYYDDCKVNGKIKILRLQKMFIPTIQALISLPENLVNKEIIELIIYYTNNNDGDLYFGDLEHFYLTDNFNNKHDSIRYREMTKFFSDKDMASLYRHMEYNIIKKNSSKLVKLYFIIPKEAESRELYLEAKDLNIID